MSLIKKSLKTLLLVPLVGAALSLACYIVDPFLQPHTFVGPHDINRLLSVYLGPRPGEKSAMTFEAYHARVTALAKEKKAPIDAHVFGLPITYFGPFPSNSYETALSFMEAAAGDVRDPAALARLMENRHRILGLFMDAEKRDKIQTILAKPLHETAVSFAAYLQGAFAFYTNTPDDAYAFFVKAGATPAPSLWTRISSFFGQKPSTWLAESALYMEGRCLLVGAQAAMSEYDLPAEGNDKLDRKKLSQARTTFARYLKAYPEGLYADSIKNLDRKFDRLEGHAQDLNAKLRALVVETFKKDPLSPQAYDALDEYMNYFTGEPDPHQDAPLALAVHILSRMHALKEETLRALLAGVNARAKDFAPYPGLASFLKALLLTNLKAYTDVVVLDPTPSHPLNKVQQGTQILRAKAQLILKDPQGALATLHALKKSLADDHLDLLLMRTHMILASPPETLLQDAVSPRVRELYLERFCPTQAIERLIEDKGLAKEVKSIVETAYTRRLLLEGSFEKAIEKRLLNKDEQKEVEAYLKEKNTPQAQLRMGEWLEENISPWHGLIQDDDNIEEECPECKPVDLTLMAPIHYFIKALSLPSAGNSDTQAEVLHRLTGVCFRGNEPAYSCLWVHTWWEDRALKTIHDKDVPKWFHTLHTRFKTSSWAKKTPYHY